MVEQQSVLRRRMPQQHGQWLRRTDCCRRCHSLLAESGVRASQLLADGLDDVQGSVVHRIYRHCEEDSETAKTLLLLLNNMIWVGRKNGR